MRGLLAVLLFVAGASCKSEPRPAAPDPAPKPTTPEPATPESTALSGTGGTAAPSAPIRPSTDADGTEVSTSTEGGRAALCKRAQANVVRLETEGGAKPQTIVLLKAKTKQFLTQCESYPDPLVACLAEAKSMADLSGCKFERLDASRPDPGLLDMCEVAYKNARNIIAAAGAPAPALARYDERKPEALIECSREPRPVVECLMSAKSMGELRACRTSEDGSVPKVADDVAAACKGIHARVFSAGDAPDFFVKKWRDDVNGFVVECARMPPAMRKCMVGATKFADFQTCAKANTGGKTPPGVGKKP